MELRIKTKCGIVEGIVENSCVVFKGIPYAKAKRFEKAAPYAWNGVLACREYGSQCPQADPTNGFYGKEFYTDPRYPLPRMSEDCLYLNIQVPLNPKGKCPVALWIHGGAFDHGFGSEMEFDGAWYCQKNVILVTINYRVGVFGFFAHPEMPSANLGLLDQVAALQWVYENIEAFGGDPDNITVFGQSAGAISVQALVSSECTGNMIAKAIMQSGGGLENGLCPEKSLAQAYEVSKKIMSLCGVSTLEEMKRLPCERLVEILPQLWQETGELPFGPIVDGEFLKEGLDDAVRRNHIKDIPYMLGATANDIMVGQNEDGKESPLFKGCLKFAMNRLSQGGKPTYLYYFKRRLPGDGAGAFHSSELWYMFGTLRRCWRPMELRDMTLSKVMIVAWTSFMRSGTPGYDAYEPVERTIMEWE